MTLSSIRLQLPEYRGKALKNVNVNVTSIFIHFPFAAYSGREDRSSQRWGVKAEMKPTFNVFIAGGECTGCAEICFAFRLIIHFYKLRLGLESEKLCFGKLKLRMKDNSRLGAISS